jgi:hypothetical protein
MVIPVSLQIILIGTGDMAKVHLCNNKMATLTLSEVLIPKNQIGGLPPHCHPDTCFAGQVSAQIHRTTRTHADNQVL